MSSVLPPSPLSYEGQTTVQYINKPFPPPSGFANAPVPCWWTDTTHQNVYGHVGQGVWIPLGGGTLQVETISGNDGIKISPDSSGNISVIGSVVANSTKSTAFTSVGSTNTLTFDLQLSSAQASSDITKVGLASFNNTEFSVDTNGFVSLLGGSAAIDSIAVDASSPPGTNPVLPTSAGLVTMTGAQVASGTVGTNVIRTNSIAANTWTAEIQRAAGASVSTVADNGVAHFNTATSSIDANGFMSPFQYAKFVVNPTAGLGTHTTITSALAAASSGDTVFIFPGTYTENFTLPAGVAIVGWPTTDNTGGTNVIGKITISGTGSFGIANIGLQTNSDYALVVSGTGNAQVDIDSCTFTASNHTAIQVTNSNASSTVFISNTDGDLATTGIGIFNSSMSGALVFFANNWTNSGLSTSASTVSSGSYFIQYSIFNSPITTSGTSSGGLTQSTIQTLPIATTPLTVGGSGSNNLSFSTLFTVTAPSLTMANAAALTCTFSKMYCNGATNWATGTGTITYGVIDVTGSPTTVAVGVTLTKGDIFLGTTH